MENLKILTLLESSSNMLFHLNVTTEIYARAIRDIAFATNLLNHRINKGIEVFDMPIEDLDFGESPKENTSSLEVPSTSKQSEQSSETNEDRKKSDVYNWTKEEVLYLIATYKENQLLFLNDNIPKVKAWEKVTEEMTTIRAQQGLPKIDLKKCKTKMEALKRHFKKIKDATSKSGTQTITWLYYHEMEDLFSEKPWVKPISTAGSNIADEIEPETIDPPPKRHKTLKDFCEELARDRKSREQIRRQEHREKIDAVNRLTNVVAQLVANNDVKKD